MARPGRLLLCLLFAIALQSLFLLLNALLGRAAGINTSLGAWFLAWPLAKLVATLPISLAGLGVREAALVAFLGPFGASAADAMAAGLLWQSVLFAGGIVGWLLTQRLAQPSAQSLEPRA
jgi:uncharacterized membrane protein YbhN (UPF0104 family)